jgi:glycosyltransferase involved in cell wall biosynthesis
MSPFLRVVLLDPVPRLDLIAIYGMAEVLAFPSLYEGFGLPIIEAMACRTPVVTSNVSSLPEVAGDAAVIVDPTDTDAIAAALIRVVTNTVLRAQMISRGIKRATDFDWQQSARQTIAVYKAVFTRSNAKTTIGAVGGDFAC